MTQMEPYARGRRDGIRWAITWLHARAEEMNDPNAKTILNTAAFNIGAGTSEKVKRQRAKIVTKTVRASDEA